MLDTMIMTLDVLVALWLVRETVRCLHEIVRCEHEHAENEKFGRGR
jgi:hypothetical protein